jgi:hypothetical protein
MGRRLKIRRAVAREYDWPGEASWYDGNFPVTYQPGVSADCPTCGTTVTMYRNTISSRGALELAQFYREHGTSWFTTKKGRQNSSGEPTYVMTEQSRLPWWGLMERSGSGKNRKQRVTELGAQWLRREVPVPKYVVHVISKPKRVEGEDWYVSDAMKERFDLDRYLAGEM